MSGLSISRLTGRLLIISFVFPGTVIWDESSSAANTVTLEYGYYDFQPGSFGQGNFWRATIHKFSLPSGRKFPVLEGGMGLCYYSMDEIDQFPGNPSPATDLKGDLQDFFVFVTGRFNLGLSKSTALYLGGRFGLHYTDWDLEGNSVSNPPVKVTDSGKYEAIGLDSCGGVRTEPLPLPLGVQIEIGTTNPFESVGDEVPFALGVSAGAYFKF